VKFDGQEDLTLIDRKTSVTNYPKSQGQALRQSQALRENGLMGRWEVPTRAEAGRARNIFTDLQIDNISVEVAK
jgi:filamentous hemagglutinin